MIQQDTIRLLRECDAGIKMGVDAIDDVIDNVKSSSLSQILRQSRKEHEKIKYELNSLLTEFHDDGKDPPAAARGMSWIKTNLKMAMDSSDGAIADLITDGCNMGVKSLGKYLNQYKAADEKSKTITKKLMGLEEKLAADVRTFL